VRLWGGPETARGWVEGLTYRPAPRRSKPEAKTYNLLWRKAFRIYDRVGPTIEWHSGSRESRQSALGCRPGKQGPPKDVRTESGQCG